MLAAIVALALTAAPHHRQLFQPNLGRATTARVDGIGASVTAGDLTGNWWLLNANGTMRSGSALTMSLAGSPGVSPLSFNGTDQWAASSNVAFPGNVDFSVVTMIRQASNTGYKKYIDKWRGGTTVFLLAASSGVVEFSAAAANGAQGVATSVGAMSTNTWYCFGATYTTATGTLKLRKGGSNYSGATVGNASGSLASTTPHAIAVYNDLSGATAFDSRGALYTEKLLSDADIDRICSGAQ